MNRFFEIFLMILTLLFVKNIQAASDVKYFGFWGDAMDHTGNGNYINETSGASNVHFVSASLDSGASEDWRNKVIQAQSKNNKVILMLEGGMFNWASLVLSSSRYSNLQSLKTKLAGLEDSIVGVYLIDEPLWKNSTSSQRLTEKEVFDNLESAASLVKQYFPGVAVALTEAAPAVNQGTKFPSSVDWIGVNCYAYYDECKTPEMLDTLYNFVAKNLLPNQKMIFTLEGHWLSRAEGLTSVTQQKLIKRSTEILRFAAKYPAVGFFPFLYQSQNETIGTAEMPLLKDYLFKLGQKVRDGTYNSNNPSSGLCVDLEPSCEGKDYVRRNSCGEEIGRWLNAPPPYCPAGGVTPTPPTQPIPQCQPLEPTCEGKDYVRRDSCGAELGRWVNAPPPYCLPPAATCKALEPTCEGKDYVRRDSCGNELGRWTNAPPPYCPL